MIFTGLVSSRTGTLSENVCVTLVHLLLSFCQTELLFSSLSYWIHDGAKGKELTDSRRSHDEARQNGSSEEAQRRNLWIARRGRATGVSLNKRSRVGDDTRGSLTKKKALKVQHRVEKYTKAEKLRMSQR